LMRLHLRTSLGTANLVRHLFCFNDLGLGLPLWTSGFATAVFTIWPRRLAIPLSARRSRSASAVYRWTSLNVQREMAGHRH
jgi:hypothetical protein